MKRSFGGPVNRHQRRLAGRVMRASQPPQGTDGTGGGGGDQGGNNDGNSGDGSGESSDSSNNSGDKFDPNSFWNPPASEGDGSGSADGSSATNQDPGKQAPTIGDRIAAFNPGEIFSKEAIDALNNEQNPEKFHQNFTKAVQGAMSQTLRFAFEVMAAQQDAMEERMGQKIEGRFGQEHDQQNLAKEFPSYKQPGMKPVIDNIFAQAMKATGNKRTEALAMTRTMLDFQARQLSGDLGLNRAPGTEEPAQTDWFKGLGLERT